MISWFRIDFCGFALSDMVSDRLRWFWSICSVFRIDFSASPLLSVTSTTTRSTTSWHCPNLENAVTDACTIRVRHIYYAHSFINTKGHRRFDGRHYSCSPEKAAQVNDARGNATNKIMALDSSRNAHILIT